ncbi:carbohydrate sulfotransferase 15-like [Haliotis asinina]|uniref:carbohydrate sulfotransferase 15-like n=1 Tax=Haliotis asinina TaxID=109174 RepID=UPI003531DBE1
MVLICSVVVMLLVLGYDIVTDVEKSSQVTQEEGQQRKGLLVVADQNSAAQRRLLKAKDDGHNLNGSVEFVHSSALLDSTEYVEQNSNPIDSFAKMMKAGLDVKGKAFFFCAQNQPIYKPVQEFKNPCWWEENVPENTCPLAEGAVKKSLRWMELRWGKILRCLPYFFIIGQAKCGTTTLFSRISQHPEVAPHAMKETHWMCHGRLKPSCSSIETYIDLLQISSLFIQSRQREGEVSQYVIGDATPNHFSTHGFWGMLPGNEGCAEPCVTDADVIHHVNPRAKLLLILRNPTTRMSCIFTLYSHYLFKAMLYKRNVSKQDFHDLVVTQIANFQNCLTLQSLRGCSYNYSFSHYMTSSVDLRGSIYQVFLTDWMEKFPKDQIHVVKFEEFVENEKAHLTEIFKFLKLSNLSDEKLESITNMKALNQRIYRADIGDMMNSTRVLLDSFYKPYNEKLAKFLKNEKWNW